MQYYLHKLKFVSSIGTKNICQACLLKTPDASVSLNSWKRITHSYNVFMQVWKQHVLQNLSTSASAV